MRSKVCRRPRGFSLLEGLFSLFVVALVMGGLVHTLQLTAQVKKNTKHLDQDIEDFHLMLALQGDLNSAMELLEPEPGETADHLKIRQVDPGQSYRVRTDPVSDPLNPYEPSEMLEVAYFLKDGYLWRSATDKDSNVVSARLSRVETFQVTLESALPSVVRVQAVVDRGRVKKTRSLDVAMRAQL